MKNLLKGMTLFLSAACCTTANAGLVTVWGESLTGFSINTINNFYDGLAGHSSSIASGTLDTVDLSATDLLWATQPSDAYSTAELDAMSVFLAGGGRIAFMGEHGTFGANQNNRINAALAALGSTISINNVLLDRGFRSASVDDGQILAHTLTAGVNTYEYAAFAPLSLGANGEALMYGEETFGGLESIMMGFENVGGGSIFLITDQNVWDNSPDWGSFDNARMFENLLSASTTNEPEPEPEAVSAPGVLPMVFLGLMGMFAARYRKQK